MSISISTHQIDNSGELILSQEDSGVGDGTTYFFAKVGLNRRLSIQVDDIPGAAGTNTYTVEATNEHTKAQADCKYEDVTNAWFGVASFTTDKRLDRDAPVMARFVRVKRVRTGDSSNEDGGSKIWFRLGAS